MSYELIRRNANLKGGNFIDNTHTCIIDMDIEKIICYKKRDNLSLLILINILTLGLINLTYFVKYDYFINFYYCICDIKHPRSKYILIKNRRGYSMLVNLDKNNYYLTFPKLAEKNMKLPLINERLIQDNGQNYDGGKVNFLNNAKEGNNLVSQRKKSMSRRSKIYSIKDDLIYSFSYRNNKYEYDEKLNKFKPVFFYLGEYQNVEIHDKLGDGIKSLTNYNYNLNKFGLNEIMALKSSFLEFFFKQISHPFYIYQIFAIVVWFLTGYIYYLIVVLVLIILVIFFNAFLSLINWGEVFTFEEIKVCQAVRTLTEFDLNEKIIYDQNLFTQDSDYLVPGDVIYIDKNLNKIIPCDCLILDGSCSVDESKLTGESSNVLKYALPKTKEKFIYSKNSKSVLLKGTILKDSESLEEKDKIKALVLNTSYNSFKGNMIQYMLNESTHNFKFHRQLYILYSGLFVIFLILGNFHEKSIEYEYPKSENSNSCESTNYSSCNEFYRFRGLIKLFDNVTVILPPILPIASTLSFLIYHYILNKNKISCFSPYRLYCASVCNKFIFDKTGTLTEDEIELSGFLPTQLTELGKVVFYKEEVGIKDLNSLHKSFWKKFCKQSSEYLSENTMNSMTDEKFRNGFLNNPAYNFIYFIECLASCHTIDKIKNIYYGNSLDKKIFDSMKWILIPKKRIANLNRNSKIIAKPTKFYIKELEQEIEDKNKNNIDSKEFKNHVYDEKCILDEEDFMDDTHLKNNNDVENKTIINENLENNGDLTSLRNFKDKRRNNLIKKSFRVQDFILYDIIPKHSHKITENLKINDTLNYFYGRTYKLGVLKRFEFISSFQSLSVIIRNNFDQSIRYYIKGAPEKVISICNLETVPIDYHEKLIELTKSGHRVLACATKLLENFNPDEDKVSLESKKDLSFLGFIILKNKLKEDTAYYMSKILDSKVDLIISTGDNVFTSISVARECFMIQPNTCLRMIDLDSVDGDKFVIKIVNLDDANEKFFINDNNENNDFENHGVEFVNNISNNNSLSLEYDKTAIINLLDNTDKGNDSLSGSLIELFKKISLNNNYKLCMSGEAFRIIVGKLKNIKKEFEKNKITINYMRIMKEIENEISNNPKGKRMQNSKETKNINQNYKLYIFLKKIITEKGLIFFRMSPVDKILLVEYLKEEKKNVVGMCGDGSNDSGAIASCDFGILIRSKNGVNLTNSHFYTQDNSISCIELIIKTGRASLENLFVIVKFLFLYGFIQLSSVFLVNSNGSDFSNDQLFFMDIVCIIIPIMFSSMTKTSYKSSKQPLNFQIFSFYFFGSVIGHTIILIGFQILLYINLPKISLEKSNKIDEYNSMFTIFTSFQYLFVLFIFNFTCQYRKNIIKNYIYMVHTVGVAVFLLSYLTKIYDTENTVKSSFIYLNYYESYTQRKPNPDQNILLIISLISTNFVTNYFYECLMNKLFI